MSLLLVVSTITTALPVVKIVRLVVCFGSDYKDFKSCVALVITMSVNLILIVKYILETCVNSDIEDRAARDYQMIKQLLNRIPLLK